MGLPIFSTALTTGRAIADRFSSPLEENLDILLGDQDTTAIPDATAAALPSPTQIAGQNVPVPIPAPTTDQAQPQVQPGMDIGAALGQPRQREEFARPQDPNFVANLLGPQAQIAGAPESVQTVNGVQEPGIAEEGREIPDVAAAEAPNLLQQFGESARAISGELATNPVLQDLLGQVAQALTAKDPTGFPFQLATGIRESAQGAQADIVRQNVLDTLAGREPDDRIDPNMLTLSPELRSRAQLSALSEVGAAASIQSTLAGIPTGQEREVAFELTQSQIDATNALTTQRNLETAQILTSTGIGQQFDSTQLSLMRLINDTANKIAAQAAGIQGVIQDAAGNTTFQFKNPEKYVEVFNNTRDPIINSMINNKALPESARLLSTRAQTDRNVPSPNVQTLNKTTQPPDSVRDDNRLPKNAKFVGSQKQNGKTLWFYDTTGDGRADTAVRQ